MVVLALVLSSYGLAVADDDPAKADAIFEEAQQLKAQGNTAEACKKYDEALVYNRNAVGTLLNVGLCNEDAGKYATAVKYYTQARDLAREHNLLEHRHAAENKLTLITPLVARLAIAFAENAENMKLMIDEEIIPVDKSEDIVVDPGRHHVVVTAPGRVPYDTYVEVEKSGAKAIAVPKLGYPVTVKRSSRRTIGKILTFSGGGLVVTGMALGTYAYFRYNGQIGEGKNCTDDSPPMCNPEGYRITNSARTVGTFGSIIGFSGLAVAGVGAYLWFFGTSAPTERNVAIVPTLNPDSAGLTAIGRF
jgi:hypothetical protein